MFFEGMSCGWASGAKPKHDFPFHGAKGYEFNPRLIGRSNNFSLYLKLLDYFFVNSETLTSYGTTIILYCGNPVWAMNYGGWYDEEAILLVKKVLLDAYSACKFFGGRGQSTKSYDLEYVNKAFPDCFKSFSSQEYVWNFKNGKELGFHNYHGGLLI